MITSLMSLFAEVELPGSQPLGSPQQTSTHIQPMFVAVAVLALAIIGFLGVDFYRQKRRERRERQKLERFREKRLQNSARPSSSPKVDKPQA